MSTYPSTTMTLRVRYHECDPQGIIFNAHFLAYFDMAIGEVLREQYGNYRTMTAAGVDLVVAEVQVRFLAASSYDDVLDVHVAIEHLGNTSVVAGFRVTRESDEIAEATIRYVFIDPKTGQKTTPPAHIRQALEPA